MLRNILVNIIVASVTGATVFAMTMTTVVKQVAINTRDIEHQVQVDLALRGDLDTERKRTDERIFQVVGLVEKQIEQNRELIALVKIQNRVGTP